MDVKKGTTTVGLLCKDGVVLAADRRATAGSMIVDKRAKKVHQITDNCAVTIAGTVSDAQLLVKLLKAEVRLKRIRTEKEPPLKEIANLLAGLVYNNIRKMSMIPGIAHFLVGGYDDAGQHLYDIYPDGSVTDIIDYVSSGSGSVFAYGVLETQFQQGITCADAQKLVVRCLNAAMQRDSATGNGIDVVRISSKGVEWILQEELVSKLKE